MIASFQRRIVFFLLAISGLWLTVFWAFGRPLVSIFGISLIFLGHTVFIAAELFIVQVLSTRDSQPSPTNRELLYAWWGEIRVSAQLFYWRQPFRSGAHPDSLPSVPNCTRGVLLVHGFLCNRAFWNPWISQLRRAGVSFIAVNLEPPLCSISGHSSLIDREVCRLTDATGLPPLIVAHSMGGLVIRHWLTACRGERVHRIITIGTPHGGSWLARFSRTAPGCEMAINSAWLDRLRQRSEPSRSSLFTNFYGNADNVVFPASRALLPGADNRLIKATGHVQLAFREEVFVEALRFLQLGSGGRNI